MQEPRPALNNLAILRLLPDDARKLVVDCFSPLSFSFGQAIVRQGDAVDGFYAVASGQARVVKQTEDGTEVSLDLLRPGDTFGEMELMEQTPRMATVRASSDVVVYKLDSSVFQALVQSRPDIKNYFELQIRYRHLQSFFRLYSPFASLAPEALRALLADLRIVSAERGELIFRQGDPAGPMYVVREGRLRLFTENDRRRSYRAYLRKGDFFGEMAVFKGTARTDSVEAVTPCTLLELAPAGYEKLLMQFPDFRDQIRQRIEQHEYRSVARVPLDFAEELLPADAQTQQNLTGDNAPRRREVDNDETDAEPFASSDGYFIKKRRRVLRFPLVRQIDEMDCGAACVAMMCRHFGRNVSLAHVRQLVRTSFDGASLSAICTAAEELGLAARSVKTSPARVGQMPLPAIVHWDRNHWIVLYHVNKTKAWVADPAGGYRRISRKEFDQRWSGYAALFDYTEEFEKAPESKPQLGWLWPFVKPFAGFITKAIGLAVIVSSLQMALPVFSQLVVDRVLVEQDVGLLRVLTISMVAVFLIIALSMILQRYLLSFAAVRMDASTLDFLVRKLLALPMTYFNTRRTGDLQRRLEGMRLVRTFIVQHAVSGLTAVLQIAVAVTLMFVYSRTLATVFLVTAPLYAMLMYYSAHWLRPIFHNLEEGFGKYHSHQIDAIKGIETVKASGAEKTFRTAMLRQFHGMAHRQFSADFTMMCYEGAIQSVTFLALVLFLWFGAYEVMNGTITIGVFVAFNALVAQANAPIVLLLGLWDNLQYSSVLIDRLNDVFENAPEQGADHSHLRPVPTLEGKVRFHKLGFHYGGPESAKILENISFEAAAGKVVAIVGRSGSGKTTLAKCLAGLLEPTEGTIYYDGIDLKTLSYRQLRRQIGFVLQDNHLFSDTIARNIALADEEPDMDSVLRAARMANAHEFIERLPFGYDTLVGETGLALSGGQRQRVAVARALYHRPPVLIFDEATSNLDVESERAIQENMSEFIKGRTAFIIAHRLSTVRDADFIVVLEKGKIAEMGNHDELMEHQGLYFYLASQQLGL